MLPANVLMQAVQDGFTDDASRFLVAVPERFTEPPDAERNPGAIRGLGDSVGVGDHDVAQIQWNLCFADEVGDIRLKSEGKAKVQGVVSPGRRLPGPPEPLHAGR